MRLRCPDRRPHESDRFGAASTVAASGLDRGVGKFRLYRSKLDVYILLPVVYTLTYIINIFKNFCVSLANVEVSQFERLLP